MELVRLLFSLGLLPLVRFSRILVVSKASLVCLFQLSRHGDLCLGVYIHPTCIYVWIFSCLYLSVRISPRASGRGRIDKQWWRIFSLWAFAGGAHREREERKVECLQKGNLSSTLFTLAVHTRRLYICEQRDGAGFSVELFLFTSAESCMSSECTYR